MPHIEVGLILISVAFFIWVMWSEETRPAMTKLILGLVFLMGALCVNVST